MSENFGDFLQRAPADALAFIDVGANPPASERQVDFGQLWAAARGAAAYLRSRGLKPGDAVALLGVNSLEYFAAHVGTMLAGMVSVPVNYRFPAETIDFVLRDSATRLVLTDAEMAGNVADDIPNEPLEGRFEEWRAMDDGAPGVDVAGEAPCLVLYTSGSTGRPKGVPLTHASQNWVVGCRLGGGDVSAHRLLVAAPYYHMNALAVSHFALSAGASIVLLPRFTAPAYIGAIGRHRCTWLTSVPTMLAMMLREKELLAATDLSSVKFVRMGSAPVTQALMDALAALFPGAAMTNGYGTTEAGPVAFGPHPEGKKAPVLSLGYPHPQVDVRLVDADGKESDEGVLEMRCPAVTPGYLNLPAKTAEAISADGFYHTGDVMRRDGDGFYYFVGRRDDMFVCGGENIYPGEVELMLEKHPDIAQACVVPVPDDIKGMKPLAAIVARPGAAIEEEAVKQFALAHAPAYMHPRRVFVMDELPLASTNKIDRKAVLALIENNQAPLAAAAQTGD
ncbi:MAG: class I adenylate-forming enzyme family protein [Alphaproteobacteria bacterium]